MHAFEAQKIRSAAVAAAFPEAKRLMAGTVIPGLKAAAESGQSCARLNQQMTNGSHAIQAAIRSELLALAYTCDEPRADEPDDGTFLVVRWG